MADQQQFEAMMAATVPNADLTRDDTGYQNEGVHAAWVGFQALHTTTTCSGEDNHENDDRASTG
ncbi:hypothetical protein [Marinobacter nauticus]|uniref:Uncharacterized protein n=1 Tax=Marinobacter nauticus TaxID=2743 RepID=A0A833NBK5_MARNT|nr:hypothetical protein [Marinobacter nauticus]KAE8546125.1 hypothetical protein F6453_1371 [Marinobacter nauticus]